MGWTREPTFLYQRWLEAELPRAAAQQQTLSPRQVAAALLQGYVGGAPLAWVAQAAGLSLPELCRWRREPAFLKAMDDGKTRFAAFFLEAVRERDFSPGAYAELAAEFALLEDSLKVRIRTRLYADLRFLAARVWSRRERREPQEAAELARFGRLTAFFAALEQSWPGPAGWRLAEEFLPLARAAVWPRRAGEGPQPPGVAAPSPPSREEVLALLLPRLQRLAAAVGRRH